MAAQNVPSEAIEVFSFLFGEILDGRNAHLTDGVQRALGREPRDFRDFVRDAAATGVWDTTRRPRPWMYFREIVLMVATITMGIGAGVYMLYAFAIMPGLARTDDRTFVGAFQQIDTAIVGPFLLVFFIAPLVSAALAASLHLGGGDRSGAGS